MQQSSPSLFSDYCLFYPLCDSRQNTVLNRLVAVESYRDAAPTFSPRFNAFNPPDHVGSFVSTNPRKDFQRLLAGQQTRPADDAGDILVTQHGAEPRKVCGHAMERIRAPGVISVLEVYRIEEAKARLGWSDSALRAAKHRGLKVIVCGKRRYVSGKEVLRFLESLSSGPSG